MATPSGAAASAISTLSVSSWRTMRPRPAPSAERTAISRCRTVALDSSRFATLAHAISSSTRLTAPIIVMTMSVMSDGIIESRSVTAVAPQP